jgi:hypothetical protein
MASDNRIGAYVGGIRSGKTIVGAHFAIDMLGKRPTELGGIFSNTNKQLTKATLKEFKGVLMEYGLNEGTHYLVNKNPEKVFGYRSKFTDHSGVWSFCNGAQIFTFSLETQIRGVEFGWVWGDEVQDAKNDELYVVMGRMSGAKEPKTFYSLTPPAANPDIDELIYGEKHIPVIFGTTYDNKANLPATYIDDLKNTYDKYTFAREVMCERVNMTGFNWLYMFDPHRHVNYEAVYQMDARVPVYVSLDFNVNPFVCTLGHRGIKDNKPYIHIFDTIIINPEMIAKGGEYIETLAKEVKLRTPAQAKFNSYYITGDASGHSRNVVAKVGQTVWTQVLNAFGISKQQLNVRNVNPTHYDSRVLCNSILDKHPQFYINPKCKELIQDCEFVKAKPDGSILKENRNDLMQRADLLDTLRYFLHTWEYDFIKW